jgi:hypothetical protein
MHSQLSIYYEDMEIMELEVNMYIGNWDTQEEWKIAQNKNFQGDKKIIFFPFQAVVFWVTTTSCLVGEYQCFKGMYLG